MYQFPGDFKQLIERLFNTYLNSNYYLLQQINNARPVKKRRPVSDEELRAHLNGDVALTALQIGIDVQRVRRAMKEKLELTGEGYSQPDALVEAALNVQLDEDDGFDLSSTNNQISDAVAAVLSRITKETDVASNAGDQSRPSIPRRQLRSEDRQPQGSVVPVEGLTRSLSLEEENRILKEARQCKICMDAEVGIVFLPCGHLATCVNCAPNLEDCPVCRSAIKATVRTFFS